MTPEDYAEALFLAWLRAFREDGKGSPWQSLPAEVKAKWRTVGAVALLLSGKVHK